MKINNSPSFTSVIPVRVMEGNEEIRDRRIVQKACREAVGELFGPLKTEYKTAAAQLSVRDYDYSYIRAFLGYRQTSTTQKSTPSDYFRIILNEHNQGFILTGKENEYLAQLGKEIGKAKRDYASGNVFTVSSELEKYKKYYGDTYLGLGKDMGRRLKETYLPNGQKIGKYQQMDLQVKTKPVKVKGQPDTKVTLENITFSDWC